MTLSTDILRGRRTKQRARTRKKIAFFGHFDSSNFGVECTLQTILYHLRCFHGDAEVLCISTGPEAAARTHKIEAISANERLLKSWSPRTPLGRAVRKITVGLPFEPYRWIKGLRALWHTELVIIPGTGLLTDAFGLSLGWTPYHMFKWSLLAKACGCKLLFVSVGAGPIYSAAGRWFVKSALSVADYRSYRDDSTRQYLNGIGFRTDNDRVYTDLVFSLPEVMIPHDCGKKRRRPVVGLGLMAFAGKYSVAKPLIEDHRAYLENLVIFVQWLLARDYDVRLLIGDLCDSDTVEEFAGLLRKRLSQVQEGRVIYEAISSVEGLLSQIAATDIVVATRFHNVVLSLRCNKPTIAISFHPKCDSLMSAMGLSAYCLNIYDLRADTLIETFCDLKANEDKVKSLTKERVRTFREALDEQYKNIFSDLPK